MRAFRRKKPHARHRRRNQPRPYMIDAEEFDFMDDCEMHDWMFGFPTEGQK